MPKILKSHLSHAMSFPKLNVTVPCFQHSIHGQPAPQSEIELTDEQVKGLMLDDVAKGLLENGSLELLDKPKGPKGG